MAKKLLNTDDLKDIIDGDVYPQLTTAEMYAFDVQKKSFDNSIHSSKIIFNTDIGEYCYYRGEWMTFSGNLILINLIDEEFESGVLPPEITVVNSSINEWVVGTAAPDKGLYSLYISNDGGTKNEYSNKNPQAVSHAICEYTLTEDVKELTIDFAWRCLAESPAYDYMEVLITDDITGIVADSLAPSNLVKLKTENGAGSDKYVNNNNFKRNMNVLNDAALISAGTYYLIFTFRADNSVVNNPPPSIDSVKIGYIPL